jgi:hypothetical protein
MPRELLERERSVEPATSRGEPSHSRLKATKRHGARSSNNDRLIFSASATKRHEKRPIRTETKKTRSLPSFTLHPGIEFDGDGNLGRAYPLGGRRAWGLIPGGKVGGEDGLTSAVGLHLRRSVQQSHVA